MNPDKAQILSGRKCRAYTIVEVIIAAGLLVFAIVAAASMALTMQSQEEANAKVARAFNLQEQAARLYQLGLEPTTIIAILPPEPNAAVTFTTSSTNVGGSAAMERAVCQLVFNSGTAIHMENASDLKFRTNDLVILRPSIR